MEANWTFAIMIKVFYENEQQDIKQAKQKKRSYKKRKNIHGEHLSVSKQVKGIDLSNARSA
jgi:hypothetical protein